METTDAVETVADDSPELDLTKTIIVAVVITAACAGVFWVKRRIRGMVVAHTDSDDVIVDAEIVDFPGE